MHVREAIARRRAVKRFDPDHRLSPAEQEELLSLAQLSPSAFNIQHCRFVVVSDPELRRRIRAVSFDQAQVTDASLLIVVCADMQAWREEPERYWSHVPPQAQAQMAAMIRQYYAGREQVQRDECMRSCGIAAQTLMLAAQGLGYESCPMDGFDFEAVGRLIDLPPDHIISLFVAIGKALEPAIPRGGQLAAKDVIFYDRFGS